MILKPLTCPHCGAVLNITADTKIVHCDFCDSDIMIEQNQNTPSFQKQNFPPSNLADMSALQIWKKKFRKWIIIQAVLNVGWVIVLLLEYYYFTHYFLLPLLVASGILLIMPPRLALKKPVEPDAKKNRKGWNIVKYYLLFAADTAVATALGIVIGAVLDVAYWLI